MTEAIAAANTAMPLNYTLTGASDWGMFVFMVGIVGALLVCLSGLVVFMWNDLRNQIRDRDSAHHEQCGMCKAGFGKEFNTIWTAIDECCPRGKRERATG